MKNKLSASRSWIMWFCGALFYGFQFILRVSPGVIANDLMTSLNLEACALGTLASFYYYGYAFMQIPAGLLLDYFGPRRPLSVACLLCGVGCVFFAWGESMLVLGIGRAFMGIGSAFGILSCIKIASVWFAPQRLSLFIGLSILLGTVGATAGGTPLAFLVEKYNWQNTILLLAGLSVILSVMTLSIVRDKKKVDADQEEEHEPVLLSMMSILRNPQTWYFGIYGLLMYIPLSGFADLWAVPYVERVYGVERTIAAGTISTFYVGLGCGAPLWPLITAYWKSYRRAMGLSALSTLAVFLFMIYGPAFPFTFVYPIYFVAGFAAAGQMVAFAGVADINPRRRAATASGVHNMMCMFSGIIAQPVMGFLLDLRGNGDVIDGAARAYTIFDYQIAFGMLPIGVLISLIALYMIKESYPTQAKAEVNA